MGVPGALEVQGAQEAPGVPRSRCQGVPEVQEGQAGPGCSLPWAPSVEDKTQGAVTYVPRLGTSELEGPGCIGHEPLQGARPPGPVPPPPTRGLGNPAFPPRVSRTGTGPWDVDEDSHPQRCSPEGPQPSSTPRWKLGPTVPRRFQDRRSP